MSEKQRIKRQTKSKIMHKQAVQVKVKDQKLKRKDLAKNAFLSGQKKMINVINNWLQLQFPKTGKNTMSKFLDFLKTQK